MQQERHNLIRSRAVTVLEMVLAMSIMAIVLTAVLPLFAGIRRNWDARQANAEIVQNARILADHLHRTLATATGITDVSPSSQDRGFIELTANDGTVCRYAVGDDGYVQFGPLGQPGDLAGPVGVFRLTCYDGNDFTTPTIDAPSIRFIAVETTFANDAPLGGDKTFTAHVYIRAGRIDSEPAQTLAPGVAVQDSIAWGGVGAVIDSYRSSEGAYDPVRPGANAVISTNATGSGKIKLSGNAVIRGDAYVGPGGNVETGLVLTGTSAITGRCGVLVAPVDIPDVSAPGDAKFQGKDEGALKLSGQQQQTLDSDHHFKSIQLSGDSVLVIEGQVTVVVKQDFEIADRAELQVTPGSRAVFYVTRRVSIEGDAVLNRLGLSPSRLHIGMTGNNNDFEMGGNAVVHAILQNPKGMVAIGDQSEFFGKIKAKSLEGGGRIHVDLDCDFGVGNP